MKWLKRGIWMAIWLVTLTYVFGFGALAGNFMPGEVEDSMKHSAKLMRVFMGDFKPCLGKEPLACGFQNTHGRMEVSCQNYQTERSAILLSFGQSNSANAGKDRYIPINDVANFNIHNGKCYKTEDPLLGPDGMGGSVWGVLGDKLIASGEYDRVLLVPFGIGGSSLAQWQTDGFLHPILEKAAEALSQQNVLATHVLWHQGESDAKASTTEENYFSMFQALLKSLREYGIDAPVYPAIATHCNMFLAPPSDQEGINMVRAAQARLTELEGVHTGPDTDSIQGSLYRHDDCHMNAKGIQQHADLWMQVLTKTHASKG